MTKSKVPAAAKPAPTSKIDAAIALLKRPEGATLSQLVEATGWQVHSVRGAMSGTLKKKRGLTIASVKVDGVRTYSIADEVTA